MKKHYFQHDEEARNDEKITQLRLEHGAYGYGIYWMIIEAMHRGSGEIADLKAFAFSINEEHTKVSEVVKTCLRVALISPTKNGGIKSNRVIAQIQQREEYIKKQKEFGRIGGLRKANNLGLPKATSSDERKGKEIKVKETTVVEKRLLTWLGNNSIGKPERYVARIIDESCEDCLRRAWRKLMNRKLPSRPSDLFSLSNELHESH